MPGRKRDANAVQVTVRPNGDSTARMKKAKTSSTKKYQSSKKYFVKPNVSGAKRAVELIGSILSNTAMSKNTICSVVTPANDIFTNQPMGRDQMFTMYNKAYVKGASQEAYVRIPNHSQDNLYGWFFIVNHWCDNNANASASEAESTQRCLSKDGKHVVKCRGGLESTFFNNGVEDVIHTKVEDVTKKQTRLGFDEPDVHQTSGAAPDVKWYFHLEVYGTTQNADTFLFNMEYQTVNTYDTIFFDPVELAVS